MLLKSMLLAGMLAVGMGVQAQTDVTDQYVLNADLSQDPNIEGNGWELLNGWRQDYKAAEDDVHVNVVEFYAGWGSLEKTEYAMKQTITLPAGDYRLAVNAFYRHGNDGDGTNDFAYIFAGEKKQNVYALKNFYTICNEKGYEGSSDLWKASNGFFKGDFSNAFDFTMETAGEIEIGFEGTFNIARSWVILGPVKLYQYTIADYLVDYNEKVDEAKALYDSQMSNSVLTALKAAVKDPSTFTTTAEVTAAIQALNEAINAANNSITAYVEIGTTLDDIRDKYPDVDVTSIDDDYMSGKLESADDVWPMFQAIVIANLGTAPGTDFTSVIINPSFEFGNTFGWTYEPSNDNGAKDNSNPTYTVENADGNYVFNIWSTGNAISQTITGLPNGLYKLSALIATDAGHQVRLFANEGSANIDADVNGKGVGALGVVLGNVTDGILTIGAEGVDGWWYKVDNFQLIYQPSTSDVIGEKVDQASALLEEPMAASAKTALQTAINNAYSGDVTEALANLNDAVSAASASIKLYQTIRESIDLVSAEDPSIDLSDIEDAYSNGTFETAADLYPMIQKEYIKNLTPEAGADYTAAIINPSFEFNGGSTFGWTYNPSSDTGAKSNDNETYAIDGADGSFVFNIWWSGNAITQTIQGLPNGQYELSAVIASDAYTDEDQTIRNAVTLIANDVKELIETSEEGKGVGVVGTVLVTVTNGTLTIGAEGFEGTNDGGDPTYYWYKVDNFKLTFKGSSSGVQGDVNGDGNVSVSDIVVIANAIAANSQDPKYDVNGDGSVSVSDIVTLANIIANSSN